MVRVKSWRQRGWDTASIQERQEGIRLVRPEQIRMLGPDAAIALVRDRNPIHLFKARYYEDRALNALFEGQKSSAPLKERASMPEAPLPGADMNERGADKRAPQAGLAEPAPAPTSPADPIVEEQAEPTAEAPSAELGVIRESWAISGVPLLPTVRNNSAGLMVSAATDRPDKLPPLVTERRA